MLPPVKFNMLGHMQLRTSGGGSSSTNNNSTVNSSPESKSPSLTKAPTPSASSSCSSASSLSPPGDSPTLAVHGRKGKNSSSSSSSNGGINVNVHIKSIPDARHQINSAFAWPLANSSQSIDLQETRSNNQNGFRGAGDGVAVGGLNWNPANVFANHQYPHILPRESPASFSFYNTHFQHQQQQHGIGNIIGSPHHHQQQRKIANKKKFIEEGSSSANDEEEESYDADVTIGESGSESGDRAESPLDFSTKKKCKLEPSYEGERHNSGSFAIDANSQDRENSDSPCSRLRNILSMKSPSIPEDMAGTVLNLSKESPLSIWCKVEGQSNNNSNSCSPVHGHSTTAFVQSNSPRPATIPISMATTPTIFPPAAAGILNGTAHNNNGIASTILPPWYSPSISPILNQTVHPNGRSLPLSFDTSPTLFPHHITAGGSSPSLPFEFGSNLSKPNNVGASSSGSKTKVTRPFKAYPKDPLSFSNVGIYGLSVGTAPGSPDAAYQQQSAEAFDKFRKQMLASSQFGKSKRGGHRNNAPYPLPSDIQDEQNDAMMRANDSGSASDDASSLSNGKNKLAKTEQQMKDNAYWERRRKNNEAAKRSRDARRAKEDEIAIRAAFLEQENYRLRLEVCALNNETARLRYMLLNRTSTTTTDVKT